MADWLLVGLQLEVTNDVRNLLTGLLRQLPVDLHGNFLALLAEDGPTAGGGGKLMVGNMADSGLRFDCGLQVQQPVVVRPQTDLGPWLTFKPNARSRAGSLTGCDGS